MAYALVVAGRAAEAPVSQLFERRTELSPYGLAILGLALQERKNTGAADIAAALEAGCAAER